MTRRSPLFPALLLGLVAVATGSGLALLRSVPAGGAGFWDGGEGVLRVLDSGWQVLPRWRWQRLPENRLAASVVAAVGDGEVGVELVWNPRPGRFALRPGETAAAGLTAWLQAALPQAWGELPATCAVEALTAEERCPPAWREELQGRLAAGLDSPAERLRLRVSPTAAGERSALLRSIAGRLPETGRRVFVLGLDGLDWDFVLPLVEAGQMPHLDRLLGAGTWGTMNAPKPVLSPLIWTSLATGVGPDVHGILDFVEVDPESGAQVPVTGRARRVPAVWNIASGFGRSVDVVGWWASWPAEQVRGTTISDRLFATLTEGIDAAVLAEDPEGLVWPAERSDHFVELRDRAVAGVDFDRLREFLDIDQAAYETAVAAGRGMEDPVDGLRRILASTETYLGSGLELAAAHPDLLMVYLEGTDTLGHLMARYLPPPVATGVDPEEAARYAAAVPLYFELVDAWIGRYLEALPLAEVTWLLVSDHGFHWREDRPREEGSFDAITAALWHTDQAAFLLAGPGLPAGGRIAEPREVADVAPTVLALLGLPPGEGWRGTLLPGATDPGLAPLDYVTLLPTASYRDRAAGPAPVAPEFLAQLRAIGYLGEADDGSAGSAGTAGGETARPAPADGELLDLETATRGQLNNLAILHLEAGRVAEAERILDVAVRRFPDYPAPYFNLHNVYLRQGRTEEAVAALWQAVERAPIDPVERILAAAAELEQQEQRPAALAVLAEAARRYGDRAEVWERWLLTLGHAGDCPRGLEVSRLATARFPRQPRLLTLHGMAAGCTGAVDEARELLGRSLALDPDQPTARQVLAGLPGGSPATSGR